MKLIKQILPAPDRSKFLNNQNLFVLLRYRATELNYCELFINILDQSY